MPALRRPKNRNARHEVYVLEDRAVGTPFYKIGITTRSAAARVYEEGTRVRRTQAAPCEPRIMRQWKIANCDLAHALEVWFLHSLRTLGYDEIDTTGNWFEVPPDEMQLLIDQFDKIANAIKTAEKDISIFSLAAAVGRKFTVRANETGGHYISCDKIVGA
jgi:hypothetical protein